MENFKKNTLFGLQHSCASRPQVHREAWKHGSGPSIGANAPGTSSDDRGHAQCLRIILSLTCSTCCAARLRRISSIVCCGFL